MLLTASSMALAAETLVADPTFGTTFRGLPGRTAFNSHGVSARWSYSRLLADGRLILAGTGCPPPSPCRVDSRLALARLNPDGSLDSTFNPAGARPGTLLFDFGGRFDLATISIDSSGRLLVAGNLSSAETVVARFLDTGLLDTTFSSNSAVPGVFRKSFGGAQATQAMVLDGSNRPLLTGHAGGVPFIARLTANGGTDFTFNAAGPNPGVLELTVAVVPGFSFGSGTSIGVDGSSRIVVAGLQNTSNYFNKSQVGRGNDYYGAPFVARITSGGTLDPSFGSGTWPGVAQLTGFNSVGNKNFSGRLAFVFDATGRILLGGVAQFGSYRGPVAFRLDDTGIEDPTAYTYSANWPMASSPFAPVSSIAPLGNFDAVGAGAAGTIGLDTTGRVYIGGTYGTGTSPNADVRMFLFRATASLQPDSTFVADVPGNPPARGIRTFDLTDGPYAWADTVSIARPDPAMLTVDTAHDRAYVSGPARLLPGDGAVAKVALGTGNLDATYGMGGVAFSGQVDGGTAEVGFGALAALPDGKHVVVGRLTLAQVTSGGNTIAMSRFDATGSVDTTFEPGGVPPGLLLWAPSLDYTNVFSLDASGETRTLVDRDGKIVVAFSARVPPLMSAQSTLIARFNADGSLDTTFNPGGTWPGVVAFHLGVAQANMASSQVVQDSARRYYVVGSTSTSIPTPNSRIGFVARYLHDGTPDPSFNDGINAYVQVRYAAGSTGAFTGEVIRLGRDGRVVVAGMVNALGVGMARFLPDGSRDVSFNSGGPLPGALELPPIGGTRFVDALLELPDGRWLIGHENSNVGCSTCGFTHPQVRRILSSGVVDSSYNAGTGHLSLASACYIRWSAARMLPDGRSYWLCAGYPPSGTPISPSYDTPPAILRLDANGERDPTFGTNGEFVVPSSLTSGLVVAHDMTLDPSGRIVIAGQIFKSRVEPEARTLVARYLVRNAPGQPCAGFGDVDSGNTFCPNVEWLKNRGITLGCTSTSLFCPADPVSRLSMAAFMNRLGTSLSERSQVVETALGAVDVDLSPVVCASADVAAIGQPIHVDVKGLFVGTSGGNASFALTAVASGDLGTTWVPLAGSLAGSVRPAHWTNAQVMGERDIAVGKSVRFGIAVQRVSGSADFTDARCHLRLRVKNLNGLSAPYDSSP